MSPRWLVNRSRAFPRTMCSSIKEWGLGLPENRLLRKVSPVPGLDWPDGLSILEIPVVAGSMTISVSGLLILPLGKLGRRFDFGGGFGAVMSGEYRRREALLPPRFCGGRMFGLRPAKRPILTSDRACQVDSHLKSPPLFMAAIAS